MDLLSDKAKKIILKTLKLKSQDDIVDLDYPPLDCENDVDRDEAILFSKHTRGSIRLGSGLFYTFKEYESRTKAIIDLKLP